MATPGEVLRSFRESRGWSRRLFCLRMNRYGWTEDILRDLEEGSIIFTEDHLKELVEAGLFLKQRITWQQMILRAIDNQWDPSGPAVMTERQPHEEKELETVIITIVKPKAVKFLGTILVGFTGIVCLTNAIVYSSFAYLGASIPFLVPLFESKYYRGTLRHPAYLVLYVLVALFMLFALGIFLRRMPFNIKPQQDNIGSLKERQPDYAKHLMDLIFWSGIFVAMLIFGIFIWPLLIWPLFAANTQVTPIDMYAGWLNVQLPLLLIPFIMISRWSKTLLIYIPAIRSATEIQKSSPPKPADPSQDQT